MKSGFLLAWLGWAFIRVHRGHLILQPHRQAARYHVGMSTQDLFAATVDHYLAPIRAYLADPGVTEVMVNHANEIFIEKDGKLIRTEARFADQEAYEAAVNNILQFTGKALGDDQPLVDTRLPDGSRVHVAKAPCSRLGTTMAIRKFSKMVLDIDWLIELGTITPQAREYLHIAVLAEQNLLVAGGTSSGKTSLLNALSSFIPKGQRIVVIEDSAELQLQQEHVISLEARGADRYGRGAVSIRDLFRSSLRLRPDRIIIGEVRGGEALDMIQAMTSGHGGSMGTLHANSPADALNRLETMALMSKVELPLHALRAQVASAIDVVVQMSRQIGGRRLVTAISEVDPLGDDGHYRLHPIFELALPTDAAGGPQKDKSMQLTWSGRRSAFAARLGTDAAARVTDLTRPILGSGPP
jgi:pilus assembly protein CpaF